MQEYNSIISRKVIVISLYVLAYILLFAGYIFFIVPVYGYSGFSLDLNVIKVTESFFLLLFTTLILPAKFDKPSSILVHLQFLFPILPMIIIYGLQNKSRSYMYASVIAFFIILLLSQYINFSTIRVRITLSVQLYSRFLLLFGWIVIGIIIFLGGLRYFNLNIWRVYEFRSAAAENLPHMFSYIIPITSKIIFPFVLLISVVRKERFLTVLSLAGSIILYGLTAHKGTLFYPFAVLVLYFIVSLRYTIFLMLLGYSAIVATSLLLYYVNGHILFGSLMLRRVIFVPAHLNFNYYDFFSQNQFVFWAKSKLTFRLIEYNYPLNIPNLIGEYFYNRPEMSANTGWLGSGYANAGYGGMFLCAVIIGLFLAVIDSYSVIIDKKILVTILTAPLLAIFMSSDLFTAILTHGLLFAFLLLVFFPASVSSKGRRTI